MPIPMKFLKLFLPFLFITISQTSFAANPGANYGCLIWNNTIYTNWVKTDYAPGNPYWGPWNYYKSGGTMYTVTYSDGKYPTCTGCVNPNYQFDTNNVTCFVTLPDNTVHQGSLGRVHSIPSVNVPIDDYAWVLALLASGLGAMLISKNRTFF